MTAGEIVEPADSIDDYWHTAVKVLTGYDMPPRETLFGELLGNDGIPLMRVEFSDFGGEPSNAIVEAVNDMEWRRENSGWRIENTDFVVPFYSGTSGPIGSAPVGTRVKMKKARITLLGTSSTEDPPAGGVVLGGDFGSSLDKDFQGQDKDTVWSNKALAQYSYGGGKAIEWLLSHDNTRGFIWNDLKVQDTNAVDLTSFQRNADAFDRVAQFFAQRARDLADWEFDLGKEDASWKGQAAGVFRDLVHALARNYESYGEQFPVSGAADSTYGNLLRRFHMDVRLAAQRLLFEWDKWQLLTGNPLRWLHDVLLEVTDQVWDHNITKVRYKPGTSGYQMSYSPGYHYVKLSDFDGGAGGYGPLEEKSTWKKIGQEAIRRWQDSVKAELVPAGKQALIDIENAFNDQKFPGKVQTETVSLTQKYNTDKAAADQAEAERKEEEAEQRQREAEERADQKQREAEERAEQRQREAEERADQKQREAEERADQKQREAEAKQAEKEAEQERKQAEKEAEQEAKQAEQEAKQEQKEAEQEAKQQEAERKAEEKQAEQEAKQAEKEAEQEAKQQEAERKAEEKQAEQEAKQAEKEAEQEAKQEEAERKADERQSEAAAQQSIALQQARRDREEEKKEQEAKQAEQEAKQEQKEAEQEAKQAEQEAEQEAKQAEQERKQEEKEKEQEQKQAELEAKQAEKEAEQERKQEEAEQRQIQTEAEYEAKQEQKEQEAEQKQAELEAKQAAKEAEQEAKQEQLQQEQEQKQAEAERKAEEQQQKAEQRYEQQQKDAEERYERQAGGLGLGGDLPSGLDLPGGGALDPDASTTTLNPDGSVTMDYPDGTSRTIDPTSGDITTTLPDGSTDAGSLRPGDSITNSDGSTTTLSPDGTLTTRFPDGSTSVLDPDQGTITTRQPDGTTVTNPIEPGQTLPTELGGSSGLGGGTDGSVYSPSYGDSGYEEELYDNSDSGAGYGLGSGSGSGSGTGGGGGGGMPFLPQGTRINGSTTGGPNDGERVRAVMDDSQPVATRRAGRVGSQTEESVPVATRGGTATMSSGMPFMPPMGGAGGPGQQQTESSDRERTSWVEEDEDVWGTDEGGAPAVIGR